MSHIKLSYAITTRNKLPYLKGTLHHLLKQKKSDEEIIIADGGSTDGTREYLTELKNNHSIEQLISEPDKGEAHGFNKCLLLARGELIKIITDDDAFYYPAITACKNFMLSNPGVDLVGTNGGFKNQYATSYVKTFDYTNNYQQWQRNHTPFSFCGLGIMIRKSSIPILGLFNPAFRRADAELSLRVTSSSANIAWYTGFSFVNISNPQSTSIMHQEKIKEETDLLNKLYLNKTPELFIVHKFKALKNRLLNRSPFQAATPQENYQISEKWLRAANEKNHPQFLWNK
jgi:glycosyltransferase involved in cell wall biosynthesis